MFSENKEYDNGFMLADYCGRSCQNLQGKITFIMLLIAAFIIFILFRLLSKWSKRATTKIQRMGVVSLYAASIVLVCVIAHWNITERTFLYVEGHNSLVVDTAVKKPDNAPDGMKWEDDDLGNGWHLYNTNCKKDLDQSGRFVIYLQSNYKSCQRDAISNKIVNHELLFKQSVGEFFEVEDYRPWLWLGAFLFIFGIAMLSGHVDKLASWVRTGSL